MNGDAGAMYGKLRANMLQDDIQELSYRRAKDCGEQYYMVTPWDYILKQGIRIMLMFLICIFACYNILFVSTPPLFLMAFRRFSAYCEHLKSFNVSRGKLRLLLALWIVICIVLNIVIWNYLERIW